jgi:hypothetical protein
VNKVNIGTVENPKMASIGDYWDEKTVESITELLREYNDLFPTTFTEMKGIAGELGEMKIPLRAEARPIRQRPYRLNPIYKQKVKAEIDRMLEARNHRTSGRIRMDKPNGSSGEKTRRDKDMHRLEEVERCMPT